MTCSGEVVQDGSFGLELVLAAVTAALVDLPADEVHQFDLLVELEV